jgi:uncharacterized protein
MRRVRIDPTLAGTDNRAQGLWEERMGGKIAGAINQTRGTVLCGRLEDAGGLAGQSRGLLGRAGLEPDEGLLFVRGRFEPFMWMHMFFMRFPIDIVFLDREGAVIRINHALRPWRVSSVVFGARRALELAAGAAARSGTMVGDVIEILDA